VAKRKVQEKEFTPEILRVAMFEKCRELGATSISVPYDGGGDDGQVEEPELIVKKKAIPSPEGTTVLWFKDAGTQWDDNLKRFVQVDAGTEEMPLKEALRHYCYTVLEQHFPGDWVNNEGGYGYLEIGLKLPYKVKLEAHARVQSTDDYVIDVETGEQLEGPAQ
jgi:hypothetical protein